MLNQTPKGSCDTKTSPPAATGRENIDSKFMHDADLAKNGNAEASRRMLDETHTLETSGQLAAVAKDLEVSGARVTYDRSGLVRQISFGDSTGAHLNIDVARDTINGQSSEQLSQASSKQARDFIAATLADPLADKGKPLPPEALAAANKLVTAVFDQDNDTLIKTARAIMNDPKLANSINNALAATRLGMGFSEDRTGSAAGSNLQFTISTSSDELIAIRAEGPPTKATRFPTLWQEMEYGLKYGQPLAADDPFLKQVGERVQKDSSEEIERAETALFGKASKNQVLPDSYTNMRTLEQSNRKREAAELEEIKKMLGPW